MPALAFFPWAKLRRPLRFGEYRLLPHERVQATAPSPLVALAVQRALTPYSGWDTWLPRRVPILFRRDRSPTADLDEADWADDLRFAEALAFCGLSARSYFGTRYTNRDDYRLVVVGVAAGGPGGASFPTRRRDGARQVILAEEVNRVARPLHVNGPDLFHVDRRLMKALVAPTRDASWTRFDDSLVSYNAANPDAPDVAPETELVTLLGAFNRLLEVWKEAELVAACARIVASVGLVAPGPLGPKSRDPRLAPVAAGHEGLVRAWLKDAYVLRGQFAHGRLASPYRSAWSLREHLLLGAFLFPLVFKAALAEAGHYRLAPEDRYALGAFGALATYDHFEPRDPLDGRPHPWNEVMADRVFLPVAAERIARAGLADFYAGPLPRDADESRAASADSP